MHIIIGAIVAISGLVWALVRLQQSGVDLNSFNPFLWMRRRRWEKMHGTSPLHRIEDPLDAAAVLIVGAAKIPGEITRESKREICALFESEFKLSEKEAQQLYVASTHLLVDETNPSAQVKKILAPTLQSFSEAQIESLLKMLETVITNEDPTKAQFDYIDIIRKEFSTLQDKDKKW